MIKLLGISMLASIALLPLRVEAQSMSLNLAPKESKALSNPTPLTINATCTIQTKTTTEKITVNVVKSESNVNGQKLHCGQKKSIHVHNNDSISVSAEPGAEVTIINQGSNVIQASCST